LARKKGKRFKRRKNWERKCSLRLRRRRRIYWHLMMNNFRQRRVWRFCKIINWLRNWNIKASKLSNCFLKMEKWNKRSKLCKEIFRYTKKSRKNWQKGRIFAKKLSKSLNSKYLTSKNQRKPKKKLRKVRCRRLFTISPKWCSGHPATAAPATPIPEACWPNQCKSHSSIRQTRIW